MGVGHGEAQSCCGFAPLTPNPIRCECNIVVVVGGHFVTNFKHPLCFSAWIIIRKPPTDLTTNKEWHPQRDVLAVCTGSSRVYFWSLSGAFCVDLPYQGVCVFLRLSSHLHLDFTANRISWNSDGASLMIIDKVSYHTIPYHTMPFSPFPGPVWCVQRDRLSTAVPDTVICDWMKVLTSWYSPLFLSARRHRESCCVCAGQLCLQRVCTWVDVLLAGVNLGHFRTRCCCQQSRFFLPLFFCLKTVLAWVWFIGQLFGLLLR